MLTPLAIAGALLFVYSHALAQTSPAPPAPAGTPSATAASPDPPPATPPGARRHDGFFLKLAAGGGHGGVSLRQKDVSGKDDSSEAAVLVHVAAGGTPSPGLALGGAYVQAETLGTDVPAGHRRGAGFVLLGPMIEGYPSVDGGFHLGAMLGFGLAALPELAGTGRDSGEGAGIAVWLGYTLWVADEWSLGLVLEAAAARALVKDLPTPLGTKTNRSMSLSTQCLMLTAVHH